MTSRAVFLDRDGVLNRPLVRDGKPYPPADAASVELYPGLRDQLQRLKDLGFRLIVVTNQPDVARGTTSKQTVDDINRLIASELPSIDKILVCFHDNADNCACRKPRPGMLLEGAAAFDVDLARSYMVGDRRGDMEAGIAAGSRTIFVDRSYNEPKPTTYDHRVTSTQEALNIIIESEIGHEEN
ncbi:MAG: HAD family hydrolase [Rhodopseudomonas palustris]|uniref:D,D-heptose 1,7-bisphosphate phosphatase n=1 Tax=Rhodopseudomonas palustris TaxID=1076 RepID=A0A933W4V5_RHOPL|nr:HAD family hydrolase [Rhodopseudomonas palustris]